MARFPRVLVPGVPLHVIQRGNNRSHTFRTVQDYERYRALLMESSRRHGCAIHAYVLMTNHVHLLVTPSDRCGPSRMMQDIGGVYVRYYNKRHERTGTLWEGRFRSAMVESEKYLLTCSRYIELNPVRALMVKDPGQYAWSSFRHNAFGNPDSLVTRHSTYQSLGDTPKRREQAYRGLFELPLEAGGVEAIRRATKQGTALGDTVFQESLEASLNRRVRRMGHGGDRRSDQGVRVLETPCRIERLMQASSDQFQEL